MNDEFADFIARLTDNARAVLQHADAIARGYGSPYIGTEHLLLGVLAQGSSTGAKFLADANVSLQHVESKLGAIPEQIIVSTGAKGLSETAVLALKMGWETAREHNQDFIGTEHILYSLLRQDTARATVLLREMHVDIDSITDAIDEHFHDNVGEARENQEAPQKGRMQRGGALDTYGIDLTAKAASGSLDVLIGRVKEVERLVTILSRRTKNNPVLIGEPGVGKTAIVEGLAQRIVREDAPDYLLDKRVVQLDMAAMVAGTKYRGEFEDRLKKVISEIKKRGNIIVFIDELHLLVGAGSAEGSMDAANILKPALARGELHLIGATTFDEYRKYIEKDTALERRLQSIIVKEPTRQETYEILKGLKAYYEVHHGVSLADSVLETAIDMADRYINDRYMPDKALDVVDEAAAYVRVRSGHKPSRQRALMKELKQLNERMEDAVSKEDYEKAALYKQRISQLSDKLEQAKALVKTKDPVVLSENDIARAIATMANIPVEKVQSSEARLLMNLERHLSKYIIGQQDAIHSVAKAMRRSRSGIAATTRPIGSFIFMGPTGVGKTELAKVLAREVFGNENALIKIDMSEFSERHSTARLVGAPAGYVGYEDGGKLTDKVRRQPYSVVLFDEIEKAHRDVFHMLLQLLEDGVLTDAKGREVSFRNCIIILTSNLGSDQMQKNTQLGFGAAKDKGIADHDRRTQSARKALERFMRPELINRFDDIITFRSLSRQEAGKVFDLMIADLKDRLVRQAVSLRVTPRAKSVMIDKAFSTSQGVRPLRRIIEQDLEHGIAMGILNAEYKKGDILEVHAKSGTISIDKQSE